MVMKREMINMMMVITTKKITGVNSRINLVHLQYQVQTSGLHAASPLIDFSYFLLWYFDSP